MTQTKTCKDNYKDRGETIKTHDLEVQGEREAQEVAARLEEMMATLIKVVLVLAIMMVVKFGVSQYVCKHGACYKRNSQNFRKGAFDRGTTGQRCEKT